MFADFCNALKIKHVFTSAYNPTSNSVSERVDQAISLALNVNKGIDIEAMETKIALKINLTVNRSFKHFPYEILNSKSVLDPM